MTGFAPFLCISASAGSGKTFQLARRVLRLLAMGAAPDRIAAYTFSRKAAGEIFDSIAQALCTAASTDAGAASTADQIGLPRSRAEFLKDLRCWLAHLHRLHIGTLDSRISQMLSAVSIELGLPPEFTLLDELSAEYLWLQSRVLNRVFESEQLTDETASLYLQLFEAATHGQSEKGFLALMSRSLGAHRDAFLAHPDPEAWKGPEIADPPRPLSADERTEWLRALEAGLEAEIASEEVRNKIRTLADACSGIGEGGSAAADLCKGTIAEALFREGRREFSFRKKDYRLSDPLWTALQALMAHARAVMWERARTRTRALHGFLMVYEADYRAAALPEGQFTFDDACLLMSRFDQLAPEEWAFRLDGEISHWLLDEFQDTSLLQWGVLEPFIAELLQDPEQARSFFYVGDVKQAIYGWRGGNAALFEQLRHAWPLIEHQTMARSFRSAPRVLELVNVLFHNLPALAEGPSAAAVARWNGQFQIHTSAKPDLPGHAEVLQAEDSDQEMEAGVLACLERLPAGMETAVLVRSNAEGARIAVALRAAGHRASLEGVSALRDDTAVEAVLAVLRSAAHPADNFSRVLVRLAGLPPASPGLLHRIGEAGMAAVVRDLSEQLPLNDHAAFSRARLRRLQELALEFDSLGDPSVDRFLGWVETARLREQETRGVVRVMTIHQSKGLGFEAVIVPVSAQMAFAKVDAETPSVSPPGEDPPWVTLLPAGDICSGIPELARIRGREETDRAYETLCVLYVALTRARQSVQLLLPAPPRKEGSLNLVHNWLAARFANVPAPAGVSSPPPGYRTLARWGSPQDPTPRAAPPPAPPPPAFPLPEGRTVVNRLEPSQEDSRPQRIAPAFHFQERDGRQLGTRVHALLQRLEWTDGLEIDAWIAREAADADTETRLHLRQALAMKELRRPPGSLELWREQKFETVLPEGWVTGVFDRVVRFADAAWIQDFKTNRNPGEETAAHYAPQMRMYRRVLADMLGLPETRIECQLLFTHTGVVRRVD